MKQNPAVWLIPILAVFIIAAVLIASFAGRLAGDAEDTSADTGSESVTDTSADTSDSESQTETETEPVTETDSDTETEHTPDTETDTSWIDGLPDMPEYDADTLGIKGGYTPDAALASALTDAIAVFDRPISFFAVDLDSGTSLSYNALDKHNAASIIKAAYVYYVCRQIDAGNASLDEKLTYTAADTVYGDGVIGKAGLDKEYTLYQVIYYTVVSSDNEGYYMLLRRFGRTGYDEMITSLGCTTALVSGTRWPDITALDMAKIWQEIYDYKDETETGKMLYDLFSEVEYMNFIEIALDVPVANKAGWNSKYFSDSGVVESEHSTYILVILSDGSYFNSVKSQFYDVVRAVDALMNDAAG